MAVYFWYLCIWLKRKFLGNLGASDHNSGSESEQRASTKLDLRPYVLQLQENEIDLASRTLRSISKAVNRLIQKGEKKQMNKLKKLLEKSTDFKGVAEFDTDQLPSLCAEEAPYCWSSVVVTLTSIAVALSNIKSDIFDLILGGVSEGLAYVSIVEDTLYDSKGNMVDSIEAARSVWLDIELYNTWLDNNLNESNHKGKTAKEILEWLGVKAKNIVMELDKSKNRGFENNTYVQKFIAANSMYRISQSILLGYQSKENQTDEILLEQLSVMIADILGACLTNLPRVIMMKCDSDAIEKREESVRIAARILGETKDILEILQRREVPNLNPDQMESIDDWRAVAKLLNP